MAAADWEELGVAAPAEHLLDLRHVDVLVADHLACELLEGVILVLDHAEETLVVRDAPTLVDEHLLHHVVDRRMVRADELADPQRDRLAELVISSPTSAACRSASSVCARIHSMIGIRAWPNTINEYCV